MVKLAREALTAPSETAYYGYRFIGGTGGNALMDPERGERLEHPGRCSAIVGGKGGVSM